jgi:hypothetical protein
MSGAPKLPALRIGEGDAAWFVAFCPYCESFHRVRQHGKSEAGMRCSTDSGSIYEAGFQLEMVGEAAGDLDAMPRCAQKLALEAGSIKFNQRGKYQRRVQANTAALRLAVLKALVGPGHFERGEFTAFMPRGGLAFDLQSSAWRVVAPPDEPFVGVGLLALVRDLFGVSEAIAGRRLLEIFGGFHLSGERALKLENAIDVAIGGQPGDAT